MLKLSGAIIIMIGILGLLEVWEERQKKRRRYLWGLYHLLVKGETSLVKERIKCTDFLGHVSGNEPLICEACKKIESELKEHRVKNGETAWCHIWNSYRNELMLSQEEANFLLHMGKAFFGKTSDEISQLFEIYKKQCLKLIEEQRKDFLEQRRVIIPVGILAGIAIIILLM